MNSKQTLNLDVQYKTAKRLGGNLCDLEIGKNSNT